jgi:hydroxymethylbilane synthase
MKRQRLMHPTFGTPSMSPIRVGTRGSRLALWQANHVAGLLRALSASPQVEIVEIQTAGDRVPDAPLSEIGGEGVFTKEIQRALLAGTIDVAVHSLKDLPTVSVDGLVLAAVPERGPSEDVFVSRRHKGFDDMPAGAVVATTSPRRRAQALHRRPDLRLVDIRGNVETRLQKLADQQPSPTPPPVGEGHGERLDGLILARAGLERLGLSQVITEILFWMLPAVGQGALGLECRADDRQTRVLLESLDHPSTRSAVQAERALLRALGGGCQVPIGVLNKIAPRAIHLQAVVLSSDGRERIEGHREGAISEAEVVGRELAQELLARGAADLLPT